MKDPGARAKALAPRGFGCGLGMESTGCLWPALPVGAGLAPVEPVGAGRREVVRVALSVLPAAGLALLRPLYALERARGCRVVALEHRSRLAGPSRAIEPALARGEPGGAHGGGSRHVRLLAGHAPPRVGAGGPSGGNAGLTRVAVGLLDHRVKQEPYWPGGVEEPRPRVARPGEAQRRELGDVLRAVSVLRGVARALYWVFGCY